MSPVNVSTIGAYIREQREQAKISLRQLAQAAGVSNPYLSQIERGLRRPSADILQQIAKGLRISAEALYVQAGFLEDRSPGSAVRDAVLTDSELNERQKQVLIEIYESFRKESATFTVQPGSDDPALAWPPASLEPAGLARWALAGAGEPDQGGVAGAEAGPWADGEAGAEAGPWADGEAGAAGGPWADGEAGAAAGPWAEAVADDAGADDEPGTGNGARATGAAAESDAEVDGQGGTVHQFPSASGTR